MTYTLTEQLAMAKDEIGNLKSELSRVKAEREWQPIETVPYDELVLFLGGDGNMFDGFIYDGDIEDCFGENHGIINWAYLPDTSKGAE